MKRLFWLFMGILMCLGCGGNDQAREKVKPDSVVVQGRIQLINGEFDEGYVAARNTWQIKGFSREFPVTKGGGFRI